VIALKAARVRKRRATGRHEGRKPYGTRPGEADVVALIHKLRRKPPGGERLSFKAIAPAERRRAPEPHRQAVGTGNGAADRPSRPGKVSGCSQVLPMRSSRPRSRIVTHHSPVALFVVPTSLV
jgi:hypothetical protein